MPPTRKSVGCDEGSFSFPEELQLVALLQGIIMQSIIIDNEIKVCGHQRAISRRIGYER
jgi:hypothetical protein